MTATTQNWAQIKTLFADAMDQPASQRSSFLLAQSTDSDLIHEVHRLIQMEQKAAGFLSGPISRDETETETPEALEEGRILANRYRIDGLIGSGGMCGGVYEAFDLDMEVRVALKTIPDQREFQTARAVTHPNVCRVFDCASHAGMRFLTMELLDGETLEQRLRQSGPLSAREWTSFARQLCAGLSAAHAAGVIHRDLKPSNIFLTSSGRVVITDFGLARDLGSQGHSRQVMGTLTYMAPEVLAGRPASVLSDIYSLGVLLHEAATGKLPVDHVKLPASLRRIIRCCLQMDPAMRPRSAQAVESSLSGLRGILQIWLQTISPACSTTARPASPRLGTISTSVFTSLSGLPW